MRSKILSVLVLGLFLSMSLISLRTVPRAFAQPGLRNVWADDVPEALGGMSLIKHVIRMGDTLIVGGTNSTGYPSVASIGLAALSTIAHWTPINTSAPTELDGLTSIGSNIYASVEFFNDTDSSYQSYVIKIDSATMHSVKNWTMWDNVQGWGQPAYLASDANYVYVASGQYLVKLDSNLSPVLTLNHVGFASFDSIVSQGSSIFTTFSNYTVAKFSKASFVCTASIDAGGQGNINAFAASSSFVFFGGDGDVVEYQAADLSYVANWTEHGAPEYIGSLGADSSYIYAGVNPGASPLFYVISSSSMLQVYNYTDSDYSRSSASQIISYGGMFYAQAQDAISGQQLILEIEPLIPSPPASSVYYLNFAFQDYASASINQLVTWNLYNSTQLLTYSAGSPTLTSGTYTLKTSYKGLQINSSSLATATYGNSSVLITLRMNGILNGYIVSNSTGSIALKDDDGKTTEWTMTGTGPTRLIVDTLSEPQSLTLNGATVGNWTWDGINRCFRVEVGNPLGNWSFRARAAGGGGGGGGSTSDNSGAGGGGGGGGALIDLQPAVAAVVQALRTVPPWAIIIIVAALGVIAFGGIANRKTSKRARPRRVQL